MRKKILSSVLGLSMMLTMLPTTALATQQVQRTELPTVTSYGFVHHGKEFTNGKLPGGSQAVDWNAATPNTGWVTFFGIKPGTMPTTGKLTLKATATTTDGSEYWDEGSFENSALTSISSYSNLSFNLLNTSQLEMKKDGNGVALTKDVTLKSVSTTFTYDEDGDDETTNDITTKTYTLNDIGSASGEKKGQFVVVDAGEYTLDIPGTRESVLGVATAHLYDNVKATKNDKGVYELTGTSYYYDNFSAFDTDAAGNFVATRVTVPAYLYGVELNLKWTVGDNEYTDTNTFTAEDSAWTLVSCLNGIADATKDGAKNRITMTLTWANEYICNDKVNANVPSSVTYTFDTSKLVLEENPALMHNIVLKGLEANQIELYTKDKAGKTTPISVTEKVKKDTTVYYKLKLSADTKLTGLTTAGQTVSDAKNNTEYSFTVALTDVTIEATTTNASHVVTLGAAAFGTYTVRDDMAIISDGEKVADGKNLSLTVAPNQGYVVDKVLVNDETVTDGNNDGVYEFTVEAATKVYVTFKEVRGTITIKAAGGGSVVANVGSSALCDTKVSLTATPAVGYELVSISVTYTDGGVKKTAAVTMNKNVGTFTMPGVDVEVTATFKKSATTVEGGAVVTPSEDGKTASATVDKDKVDAALKETIEADKTTKKVEIALDSTTTEGSTSSTSVELPKDVVTTVTTTKNDNKLDDVTVTVKTDAADVSVNSVVLGKISNGATLTVEKSDAKDLNDSDENKVDDAVEGTDVINVKFVDNKEKSIDVEDNDSVITLTLNFGTDKITNKVIKYVKEDGTIGTIKPENIIKMDSDGTITFTVNHLTTFYLANDPAAVTAKLSIKVDTVSGAMGSYASKRVTVSGLTVNGWITIQKTLVMDGMAMMKANVIDFAKADNNGVYTFYVDGNFDLQVFDGMITSSAMLSTTKSADIEVRN